MIASNYTNGALGVLKSTLPFVGTISTVVIIAIVIGIIISIFYTGGIIRMNGVRLIAGVIPFVIITYIMFTTIGIFTDIVTDDVPTSDSDYQVEVQGGYQITEVVSDGGSVEAVYPDGRIEYYIDGDLVRTKYPEPEPVPEVIESEMPDSTFDMGELDDWGLLD